MLPTEFSPKIKYFETTDSTNLRIKELAKKGETEGFVVLADQQTAGRGRNTHTWHSPKGGLYFSILLKPKEHRKCTDLAILAGTALAQAVKESLPKNVEVTVKWPNDCLVGWKKIGGILCESLGDSANGMCIVGIGLNVNLEKKELEAFEKNPFGATSFVLESTGGADGGGLYNLQHVLHMVLKKLFALYTVYHEQGFQPIQFLWEKNCQFVGKRIELREPGWRAEDVKTANKDQMGTTTGTFLGIDDGGALVLSNARGERHSYVNGEITSFWP